VVLLERLERYVFARSWMISEGDADEYYAIEQLLLV